MSYLKSDCHKNKNCLAYVDINFTVHFHKEKKIIIIPYLLYWTGTEMSQNTAFSLSTSAKTIESESLHNAVLSKFVMEQCAFTNECAMKIWRRFVLTVAN